MRLRLLLALSLILAGPALAIAYFNARYEPPDIRVIHGLGQYIEHFYTADENWRHVDQYTRAVGRSPALFSVYKALDPLADSLSTVTLKGLSTHFSHPPILLVGIVLYDVQRMNARLGTPRVAAEQILSGNWDYRIRELAESVKALNAPVFLRPGFEFGSGNSGAHADPDLKPEQFRQVWLRLHRLFRDAGVTNAAWVWNTVNPQDFEYMQWYPGDEYVDWWGINYFTFEQMHASVPFLIDARSHRKPVLVCESCPIHDGGTDNPATWQTWFAPLFRLIREHGQIKGLVYISDPWDKPGFWEDWADSRIGAPESDSTITARYVRELKSPQYIHLEEYLHNPGLLGK